MTTWRRRARPRPRGVPRSGEELRGLKRDRGRITTVDRTMRGDGLEAPGVPYRRR